MASTIRCDVAIVGGGLAGGLLALALRARHPGLSLRLIEGGERLGGNHVWSFFGADVAQEDRWLLDPADQPCLARLRVAFPGHERSLEQPYYSIESGQFDAAVRAALPDEAVMTGAQGAGRVGHRRRAAIGRPDRGDRRGRRARRRRPGKLELGWQKFLGRELQLAAPHGRDRPTVMDARVAQLDGYRFMYSLPFAADRMFVEDTYFADTPKLTAADVRKRIEDYASEQGWTVLRATREETGVLPITLGGDFDAYWQSGGRGVAKVGMRAGLFQPATGYSLPDAVRLAVKLAARRDFAGAALHEETYDHAQRTWRERRYLSNARTRCCSAPPTAPTGSA